MYMVFLFLFIILIILFLILVFVQNDPQNILYNKIKKETFENNENENITLSDHCPALLTKLNDTRTRDRLKQKFKTIKNDGTTFLGFRNKKKPFNADYQYCYIETLDPTQSKDPVPCQKDNGIYDYAMINSVNIGTIQQPGEIYPRDVCIMEVDGDKADSSDVLNMGEKIERHDNKHLMETIDEYKETVRKLSMQINSLQEMSADTKEDLEAARNNIESCAMEKSEYLRNNILLQAKEDAYNQKVVILNLNNFFEWTENSKENNLQGSPRWLSFHIHSDNPKVNVPLTFNITHIFVPKNKMVRLTKKNGTYIDFGQSSKDYPLTSNIDTFNTIRVALL